jgi:Domain of unknown function (DUF4157)
MTVRVIQGFFLGGGTRPLPQVPVAQPKTLPRTPGPPVPAHAPHRPVVQRQAADSFPVDPVRLGLTSFGGRPLPDAVRGQMEAALGADFSGVRVHVGPQAERIGAIAFTTGSDIYFAPGRFQPETAAGRQLLGHELAHVLQQRQGRVRNPLGASLAVVQDRALEAEADRLGARVASRPMLQAKTEHGARQPVAPVRISAPISAGPGSVRTMATIGVQGSGRPSRTVTPNGTPVHRPMIQGLIKVRSGPAGQLAATGTGKRPQGNLRGKTGDHITAYVTMEHQLINAIYGFDIATAWQNLMLTLDEIEAMPGYAASAYKKQFAAQSTRLRNFHPTTLWDVEAGANHILEIRNMLKYSAYKGKKSTGGQNEALTSGLQTIEFKLRRGESPTQTKAHIIKVMMGQAFDRARFGKGVPKADRGNILTQHIRSMLDTYWRIRDYYRISYGDLNRYYRANINIPIS